MPALHPGPLLAALALLAVPSGARAELAPDYQAWSALNVEGKLDAVAPGLRAGLNAESRWLDAPRRAADKTGTGVEEQNPNTVLLLRPTVGYQLLPWLTASLGYAWQPIFYRSDLREDVQEHRVFQQLAGALTFGRLQLRHRTRLEQRYRATGDNDAVAQGEGAWAHRVRQQVRLLWTLVDGAPWQAVLADEVFFHLNETAYITRPGLDQNRALVGFAYRASPALTVELAYLNQYVRRFTDRSQLNHVLSTSLSYAFELAR